MTQLEKFSLDMAADVSQFFVLMKQKYNLDLFQVRLLGPTAKGPLIFNGKIFVWIDEKFEKREAK